ncbi:MAG: hypothetical protein JWP12_1557 [Bacteroidetes bacterium]|nr:hypothetical protein [Bacteroidota bacterium]
MKKILLLSSFMAILWVAMSFSVCKTSKEKLMIDVYNFVGDDMLRLDTVTYKNELGQSFTVTNFKYYISNITLKNTNGKEYKTNTYFLVDEADAASKELTLNDIPDGTYSSVEFTLGIDSLHNCNGAQTGVLDPVNGMFWAWNSGYVFLKLEGKSPASLSPGHIFEYHIGGYKSPNNCIRKINLTFDHSFAVNENEPNIWVLRADVSEILKTPETIDFSKLSSVTDFHHATEIADNYKDMFDITHVGYKK